MHRIRRWTASEQLRPLVYAELRDSAEIKLAREKPGHRLQATALNREACVLVIAHMHPQLQGSSWHFYSTAVAACGEFWSTAHVKRKPRCMTARFPCIELDGGMLANGDCNSQLIATWGL